MLKTHRRFCDLLLYFKCVFLKGKCDKGSCLQPVTLTGGEHSSLQAFVSVGLAPLSLSAFPASSSHYCLHLPLALLIPIMKWSASFSIPYSPPWCSVSAQRQRQQGKVIMVCKLWNWPKSTFPLYIRCLFGEFYNSHGKPMLPYSLHEWLGVFCLYPTRTGFPVI